MPQNVFADNSLAQLTLSRSSPTDSTRDGVGEVNQRLERLKPTVHAVHNPTNFLERGHSLELKSRDLTCKANSCYFTSLGRCLSYIQQTFSSVLAIIFRLHYRHHVRNRAGDSNRK